MLDRYAAQWKPNHDTWRFLTGPVGDVRRVLDLFGVSAFAFPASQISPASVSTVPLPHVGFAGSVQLDSQPSPLVVLPSSHCSPVVTMPLPHAVAVRELEAGVDAGHYDRRCVEAFLDITAALQAAGAGAPRVRSARVKPLASSCAAAV